jgi:Right handed beta helix region
MSAKPSADPTNTKPSQTAAPTASSEAPVQAASGCSKPSAANTGASGSRTRKSTTVLSSGQTLENADVSSLEITGSGVSVRNVKVDGYIGVVMGSDVTLDHVTTQGIGISSASRVTVQYANIGYSRAGDAIHVTSDRGQQVRNVVLRHNYIHDPQSPEGAHYDGTQVRGVDGLVIECNVYDPGPFQWTMNAAVYLEDANGGNSNVRVSDNWLYGYAFPVMIGAGRSFTLRDNKVGGDIKWDVCYRLDGLSASEPTSSGNVWDPSGKPLDLCGPGS